MQTQQKKKSKRKGSEVFKETMTYDISSRFCAIMPLEGFVWNLPICCSIVMRFVLSGTFCCFSDWLNFYENLGWVPQQGSQWCHLATTLTIRSTCSISSALYKLLTLWKIFLILSVSREQHSAVLWAPPSHIIIKTIQITCSGTVLQRKLFHTNHLSIVDSHSLFLHGDLPPAMWKFCYSLQHKDWTIKSGTLKHLSTFFRVWQVWVKLREFFASSPVIVVNSGRLLEVSLQSDEVCR